MSAQQPTRGTFTSTNPRVNMIANRLSLRDPQRVSLDILAQLCDILPLEKAASPEALSQSLPQSLAAVQAQFPQNTSLTDFEREFPSLCFALATGVGKTRLMGAFISFLHLVEGMRHFFVLAPNLTIYNKLISDFTPGTAKYVFQGISEFVTNPPEIITGDNYESGRGVRSELYETSGLARVSGPVHVNVFNISKINAEVRGGNSPRIKRLSEYIGESYFEYLSKLPDLVLLMDESHRYRASAGVKAINELRPVLGLELTATPQVESSRGSVPFKNVIYSYPLSLALKDGFVKQPAVATRQNFNKENYDAKGLEKLKLEDGVRIHEDTKAHLAAYAVQHGARQVKPFVLVVARTVEHAEELKRTIEADEFFEGQYRGKVIVVHSEQGSAEKDDTIAKLLEVERSENPVEIVVHVNMLKEGWDVTNLYTIVPLRTADSKTLVEQSIGRGLRLPYGRRVGVPAVDRLTIVAHDRFQEIVDEANRPDSMLRSQFEVVHVPEQRSVVVVAQPVLTQRLGQVPPGAGEEAGAGVRAQQALFRSKEDIEAAQATMTAIRQFEKLGRSADLLRPEVQAQLVEQVTAVVVPAQPTLEGVLPAADVKAVVEQTTRAYIDLTIDIPRIVVVPKEGVAAHLGFRDFDLDTSALPRLRPVEEEILMKYLDDNRVELLARGTGVVAEAKPEDYLVRGLIDQNDVCYDDHAELLYKLAGQMIAHLRSYLPDEQAVENVLQYHQHQLVGIIHGQMQRHAVEPDATQFEAQVSKGFEAIRPGTFTTSADEKARPFRAPVEEKLYIRSLVFEGFSKCLVDKQRFDSDTERRLAVLVEDDASVRKWVKPAPGQLRIDFQRGESYEPDFVVETETAKLLIETKRSSELSDERVQAKARAAAEWCRHATAHAKSHGGKLWSYLLVPHDRVRDGVTLAALVGATTFAE